MRKIVLSALGALAMAGSATAAQAATTITFDILPGASSGTYQSGVGVLNLVSCDAGPVGCAGNFTASGTFNIQEGFQLVGATLSTGPTTVAANDINFLTATLNGVTFNLFTPDGGVTEFGNLMPIALQGVNTLVITGTTGGAGTFTGNLNFAVAAVPEPGTWAMMLLGFGAIGFSMRRRRAVARFLPQAA